MAEKPLKTLYNSLKADNYDVPDNYESFERTLTAPGAAGTNNRIKLYGSLKANNYDVPDTYESFAKTLFAPVKPAPKPAAAAAPPAPVAPVAAPKSVTPVIDSIEGRKDNVVKLPSDTLRDTIQQKQQQTQQVQQPASSGQAYKPSEEQMQAMRESVDATTQQLAGTTDRLKKIANPFENRGPLFRIGATDKNKGIAKNKNLRRGEDKLNPETGELEATYVTTAGNEYDSPYMAGAEQDELDKINAMPDEATATQEQVASLSDEIDKMLLELKGEAVGEYADELQAHPFQTAILSSFGAASPTDMQMNIHQQAQRGEYSLNPEQQQRAKEILMLEEAQRTLRDSKRIINEADINSKNGTFGDWYNQSFLGGAFRGFGQKVSDLDTWDFGISDVQGATALLGALNKADKGEPLSKAEQALLDAKAVQMATNIYFGSQVGKGYKAGQVTAESLPFMLEMAINPANAAGRGSVKMLMRYALKRFGKEAIKKNAKKYIIAKAGARVVGDVLGAAAQSASTSLAHTLADTANRMSGDVLYKQDEDTGKIVYDGHENQKGFLESLGKAYTAQTIEHYSEMFGEYFGPVVSGLTKGTSKAMSRIGLKSVADFVENVGNSNVAKAINDFAKQTQWHGTIGEYAEEVAGSMMNALTVGDETLDTDKDTGVFNLDKNIDTFLGVAIMGGFMSGVKTISYRTPKRRAKNEQKRAAKAFKGDEQIWNAITAKIDSGDDAVVKETLANMLGNEMLNQRQRQAILQYAKSAYMLKGLDKAEAKRREESGETQERIEEAYDKGYNLANSEEMRTTRNIYDAMRKSIYDWSDSERKRMGYQSGNEEDLETGESYETILDGLDNDPINTLKELEESGVSQQTLDFCANYVNTKAAYDGMMQKVRDTIDDKVSEATDEIEDRTNTDTGMIHAATMKEGDRQVYIVGGNVTLNDDGTINKEGTSESLIVRDAQTGALEFVAPSDILKVDEAIEPGQEVAAAATVIENEELGESNEELGESNEESAKKPTETPEPTQVQTPPATEGGRRPVNPVDAAYPDNEEFVMANIGKTFTLDDGAKVTIMSYDPQQTLDGRKYPYATIVVEQNGEESEQTIHVDDLADALGAPQTMTENLPNEENNVNLQGQNTNDNDTRRSSQDNNRQGNVGTGNRGNAGGLDADRRTTGSGLRETPAADASGSGDTGDIERLSEGLATERPDNNEGGSRTQQEEAGHQIIENAKSNGRHIPIADARRMGERVPGISGESEVYIDKASGKVYKIKDPFAKYPMKRHAMSDVLWEHELHNILFPNTAYTLEGVSDDGGDLRLVLSQPYLSEGYEPASQEQIDDYLVNTLGLRKENAYYYGNDDFSITDVGAEGDNVFVGDNGELYFVDPIIQFKKPAKDVIARMRGERPAEPEGVSATVQPNTIPPSTTQPTVETPVATQPEVAPMPFDTEGEPDWAAVTPERAHAYIFNESGYSREDGKEFVKVWLDDAENELKKASRMTMPKITKSMRQNDEARAKRQARIDAAKAQVDYWRAVAAAQTAVESAEVERRVAEQAALHAEAQQRAAAEAEAKAQAEAERKAVGNANPMPAITEKWNNAAKVDGARDEIVLPNGERLKGHYVLHEAGASSPSHNPETWEKTEGFPMDANDNSVNDRDYERDKDAQRVTEDMARAYDQRALQTPVVVSQDGVVLSGNGRTMAGELAARDNTDGAYVDYLKEYAHKYGFTPEQVGAMQHPRVSFVPDEQMPYNAETFAKFNQQEMKSQNKTEQAVKLGKTVNDNLFGRIVNDIKGYDTLGDFYNDANASVGAVYELHNAGIIPQAQLAEMVEGPRGRERLSTLGKEFLENMLIGKAFGDNPDAVRMLTAVPSMRQSVITALGELVDNIALGEEWSLQEALAGAVKLVYEARNDGYGHGDIVSVYAGQGVMFADAGYLQTVADFNNATMLMLADVLNDKRVTMLKTTIALYNGRAREAAAGQGDMFAGGVESRDDILNDIINYVNNGNRKEIEAARTAAAERRKAERVQQNGAATPVDEGGGKAEGEVADNVKQKREKERKEKIIPNLGNKYSLSAEEANNGELFYQNSDGSTNLATIPDEIFEKIGINPLPFKLTETMGWHVYDHHAKEAKFNNIDDAIDFVLSVINNVDHVRLGRDNSYIFSIEDNRGGRIGRRAITIIIESKTGKFVGISTSGYETIDKLKQRPLLWKRGADTASEDVATPTITTIESQQGDETSSRTKSQSNVSSDDKVSEKNSDEQGKEEKNASKESATKSPNTVKAEPAKPAEAPKEETDAIRRIAAHFPMETEEEFVAFENSVDEMEDWELLAYMREDGNGNMLKAHHPSVYDEYDYRHGDEQDEAYDDYMQRLRVAGTTLEQAEEMLANLGKDMSAFATEERPYLLGQDEALQDYITELKNRENLVEGGVEGEAKTASSPTQTGGETDVEPQPIGKGVFGDIFDQFKGKVKEAFDFLMKRKSGDLLGVFHRAEIGDIDLVWGSHERHEGLEHIIQDHLIDADDFNSVEELMSIINDVINNGKIEPRESQDKVHIEKDGYRVSIKKQYRDDKGNVLLKKNWVITAFDTKRKERDKKRTSPRGTLTTPPSNPSERIDGVTLPSSDASSADKVSDLFGDEQEKNEKSTSEKIDDVGERLEGARKDMRHEIAKTLANITEAALVENPFGKVYKKPDLKKAVESGALREKDAIFYEAMFSTINQQKPKVTQSEMRSKRYIPGFKTKAERWAASTYKGIEALRLFMEADEAQRDALIDTMMKDRYPNREKELENIEQRKRLNPDRPDHKYEWGEMTTPNPLWVTYEVMNRLGYNVGDKVDIPYGVVRANTSGTGYSIENLKGERAHAFGSGMGIDEAIDAIVYLARLKRGDGDISHPTRLFSFPATKSDTGESGRYRVVWGGWRNIQDREFENKEDAEAFAAKKKGAIVSPITEIKRRYGYKVRFNHPLTSEKYFVDDAEFDSQEEARAYFDDNFEALNEATNAKLEAERGKKAEKKALTADDVVHVTMLHTPENGWKYAVVIDKKYANNMGEPYIIREGFADRNAAKSFADSVKDEVLKAVLKHREEGKKVVYFDTGENSRVGEDYRNGKDVTAEDFMNAFGFRGVQFGNWTNQADRQMAVNQAYDAFMDMAKLIGVSPRAMSLNGELGIAFGARGVGGFAAHYEPGTVVINLTKTQGAGSLAHEWWHALDNYFSRREGRDLDMVTDNRQIVMRDELRKAFNDMLDLVNGSDYAIRSRAKGEYWGRMHEITARLLAEWADKELKRRGELNTFLSRGAAVERGQRANYMAYTVFEKLAGREPMSFDDYKETPESLRGIPYPSPKEVEQFGAAMRNIFDTIEERIDEETGNSVLYQRVGQLEELTEEEIALRDALVERMRGNGVEVITDDAEGQRVLDEGRRANELLAEMKKNRPKSRKLDSPEGEKAYITDISEPDGAKVLQNIESLAKKYEEKSNQPRTFLNDLAIAIGARKGIVKPSKNNQPSNKSKYATFMTLSGVEITIRLANHNATSKYFDDNGETEGISIVVSGTPDNGIKDNGYAHVMEYYYSERDLRKSDGKPLVEIIKSLGQSLRSGIYKDTTGLAKPHEVNGDILREMRAWHGSAADFDAFDHSHMGEGEGAQAIGYGTYVTTTEGIGRYYADGAAKRRRIRSTGDSEHDYYWKGQKIDFSTVNPLRMACDVLEREGTINKAIARVEKFLDNPEAHEGWRGALDILRQSRKSDFKKTRADYEGERVLYEVEIPDRELADYLKYDEQMNAQKEIVEVIDNELHADGWRRVEVGDDVRFTKGGKEMVLNPTQTGADLYKALSRALGGDKAASEFLQRCGVTGIEYPTDFFSGGNEQGLKNYVIFNESDVKITNKTKYFRTKDGQVYGFVSGGKIYLDPKIATAETPIHEYSHLWAEELRQANLAAWRQLVGELQKEQDVVDYVKALYPELSGTELWDEVFAHYSGRRGAERLRRERDAEMSKAKGVFNKARIAKLFNSIARALRQFWNMSRRLFAGNNKGLDKTSAEDFADMALADMLKGEKVGQTNSVKYMMGDASETFKARQRRAVEQKGVVMPGLNYAEVKVVDVPRHTYTGTIKEATRQAVEAAKAKYVPNGRPRVLNYDNYGTEFRYSISGGSITESLNPRQQGKSDNKGVHLALAEHLDDVIGNSIEAEEHPDRLKTNGERDNDNINPNALMHRFYGVVRVDGADYRVMTLMREDSRPNEGNGVHAYEVTKIEVLDEETPNTSNGVGTPNSELEAYPLAKVIKKVGKTMEPGKKLLTESKIADKEPDYKVDGKVRLTSRNVLSELSGMGVDKLVELKREIQKRYGGLTKPYRQVYPTPTIDDYYISTEAEFDVVDDTDNAQDTWREMVDSGKYEYYRSDSGSEYLTDRETGDIYRYSDHWGKVRSCYWVPKGEVKSSRFIGKANIKDFVGDTDSYYSEAPVPEYSARYGEALAQSIANLRAMLNDERVEITEPAAKEIQNKLNKLERKFDRYSESGDIPSEDNYIFREGVPAGNYRITLTQVDTEERSEVNYITGVFDVAEDVAMRNKLGIAKVAEAAEPANAAIEGIKAKHPNAAIFVRNGEGYRIENLDDATAMKVLGSKEVKMKDFESALTKIAQTGKRVVIVDDIESAVSESDALYRDGDEAEDILSDDTMSFDERVTAAAVKLSADNAGDRALRDEAMRAIGGNLSKLRKAMSLQRQFDMTTVKRVADLAKILLDNGYIDILSRGVVKRLLAAVKNSTGRNDIEESVQEVMDIMVDNQLRSGEAELREIESIKGSKVDARGVEVQGELDPAGARTLKAFKKARHWEQKDIEEAISDAEDRMSSADTAVAEDATQEYIGLQFALEYNQNIRESKTEERKLRDELEQRHDELSADELATDAYKQFVTSVEDAIRQNKIDRVQSYYDLVEKLAGNLRGSIDKAKAFKEAEKKRIGEIHHNANSDMQGRPSNEHYAPKFMDKFVNNSFVSFVLAPLQTFDQMLRLFGNKSANGEGYLYNRFMRGWVDAREKEIRGVRDKFAILDSEAAKIIGGNVKSWADVFRYAGKLPKAVVTFWDGGEMKDHKLTQGNLMYIYMVDKMDDGRMKLRRMGITEENVAEIEAVLDPKLKELADWLQEEFLVKTRNEYNETHKRLFGASMAAIENYFPLKILENDREDTAEELDQHDWGEGISTATGAIKKRRRNTKALDITNADALHVILDHVAEMEHWNAFAEFNRDLNTLRTYKHFRNQVINMRTAYGSGKKLWERFNAVCQMASGSYRPQRGDFDAAAVNLAKGATAAMVSCRVFTALKQLLSAPAYIPEVRADHLAKSLMNPFKAWSWCIENLPIMEERWKSRTSGDPRLLKTNMDWKAWRSNAAQMASRVGMSPNAFVDFVTVSIGAYAIYKTRLGQYVRDGYSLEAAERKAKQDATILPNQTQQSSEGAFTSPVQVNRSWLSVMFTVFRNASMSYQRQLHDAIRNLSRNLTPGQKAASIEFMKKQLIRDGVDEDKAEQSAKRKFKRQLAKDTMRVAVFGYIMQLAWNLGAYLPYLLFGDDDDEKQKMWDDVMAHSMFGWFEGLASGDVASNIFTMKVTNDWDPNKAEKSMPLTSEIWKMLKKLFGDKVGEGVSDMINILVMVGIGVNPQSITDAVIATIDLCGGDPALAHEASIYAFRVLQVPQSQIDKMYLDEIDLAGSEVGNYSFEQLVERYARNKIKRNAPVINHLYSDEFKAEQKEKAGKRLTTLLQERLDRKSDDDIFGYKNVGDEKLTKEVEKVAKKRLPEMTDADLEKRYDEGDDKMRAQIATETTHRRGGKDMKAPYSQSKKEYYNIYRRKRTYFDLAEDIALEAAIKDAKDADDVRMTAILGNYNNKITELIRTLEYGDADERMEQIRTLRQKALKVAAGGNYETEVNEE